MKEGNENRSETISISFSFQRISSLQKTRFKGGQISIKNLKIHDSK
jgi:hypothetical protein